MERRALRKDPYNIIITGVGGQGNVLASRILANMLVRKGFTVTIGETFGGSQRGGSVMSHLRVSLADAWSPLIPKGKADLVVALEPIEAIRLLASYGSADVKVLTNMRPIYPAGVIAGQLSYPSAEEIRDAVQELSGACWFLDASEEALKLGSALFGNVVMIGAAAGIGELPLDREDFRAVIAETMAADRLDASMTAFDAGAASVRNAQGASASA
jgi:indolepyruvate ferredoxin oxidoreductase, beta subunit